MTILRLLIWTIILPLYLLASEPFTANVKLSSTTLELPSPLTLILKLTYPKGYRVDEESLLGNLLRSSTPTGSAFQLQSNQKALLSQANEEQVMVEYTYKLEPQQTGTQYLTFLNISFFSETGSAITLMSDIFAVEVILPLVPPLPHDAAMPLLPLSEKLPIDLDVPVELALKDDPQRISAEAQRNAAVFANKHVPWQIFLVTIFFGIAWWYLWRRPKPQIPPVMQTAADQYGLAVRNLSQLQIAQESCDRASLQHCVKKLDEALRYGIKERYQLDIFTKNSEELRQLALPDISGTKAAQQWQDLLSALDNIKFSGKNPSLEACQQLAQAIKPYCLYDDER